MQGIPETHYVPREYSVAVILQLLLHGAYNTISSVKSAVLYFYISILRSMCAVPSMVLLVSYWFRAFPVRYSYSYYSYYYYDYYYYYY